MPPDMLELMAFQSSKDLKLILHPYLFVLKEGAKIQSDFLDYSLLMLQVTSPEIIRSPLTPPAKQSLLFNHAVTLQSSPSREAGN